MTKRAALSQSQTLRGALCRTAAPNTSRGVAQGHLAAPQMKRKPLGDILVPGTISDSSSSSVAEGLVAPGVRVGVSSRLVVGGVMNKSLNSSFLQTFSNMNTVDQSVLIHSPLALFYLYCIHGALYSLANQRAGKENPPGGPYLRISHRAPLVTTHVINPATCHLLQIPSTIELSCSPVRSDVVMLSPRPLVQLPDPLIDIDALGTGYLFCPEYGQQMFLYLKSCEQRFMPRAGYLSRQQDVSEGTFLTTDSVTMLDTRQFPLI